MGLWEFFFKQRNLSQLDGGLSCFSRSKSKWLKCHFYQSLTKLTDNQTKSIFILNENFHLSMLKLMVFSTIVWNFDQDWPWLTHIMTSFFDSKKKGLTVWVRKFMVHVIDNLTLFNLTVHGPKSNLKWARYSGEKTKKKKIASWFKVTMCHYSSVYWIISKRPQSCPNKMSLERACDDFHFGELNLFKFHLIKVNLPKI